MKVQDESSWWMDTFSKIVDITKMTLASVFPDDISANLNFIQSVLTVDCSVNDIANFFQHLSSSHFL